MNILTAKTNNGNIDDRELTRMLLIISYFGISSLTAALFTLNINPSDEYYRFKIQTFRIGTLFCGWYGGGAPCAGLAPHG
jgi:hypothetical protein